MYTPENPIYHDLLKEVSNVLNLTEPFSVSSSKEMESVITERKILAGVRFHSDRVNETHCTLLY